MYHKLEKRKFVCRICGHSIACYQKIALAKKFTVCSNLKDCVFNCRASSWEFSEKKRICGRCFSTEKGEKK